MPRPGDTPTKSSGTRSDYSKFDIKQYLRDKKIKFLSSGRNISIGWIGLNCPYCGDKSTHFGISSKGTFNCWVCGETGTIVKYIATIEGCRFTTAESILERYRIDSAENLELPPPAIKCEYPKGCSDKWPETHLEYLRSRNFNPDDVIPKYSLKPIHILGDFPYSIVSPVIMNNIMVNYVVMDIFRGKYNKRPKYQNCSNDKAIIPIKSCLYNLDRVNTPNMIIVEGMIDAWRIGDGAIATLGTSFTQEQLLLILKKSPKKIFIVFDPEPNALQSAKEMAFSLASIHKQAEVIELPDRDPGDLDSDQVKAVRRLLYE